MPPRTGRGRPARRPNSSTSSTCYWKDDLSPLLDRIFSADALILGSPIYLGDVTSQLTGLLERLRFCSLSYDDYSNYFRGSIDVAVFLTMNAPFETYERAYREPM